jgi:hypothetical protein
MGGEVFSPNTIHSLGRNSYRRQLLHLNFNFFNSLHPSHPRHGRNRGAFELVFGLQTTLERYIGTPVSLKSRIYTLHASFSYILNVVVALLIAGEVRSASRHTPASLTSEAPFNTPRPGSPSPAMAASEHESTSQTASEHESASEPETPEIQTMKRKTRQTQLDRPLFTKQIPKNHSKIPANFETKIFPPRIFAKAYNFKTSASDLGGYLHFCDTTHLWTMFDEGTAYMKLYKEFRAVRAANYHQPNKGKTKLKDPELRAAFRNLHSGAMLALYDSTLSLAEIAKQTPRAEAPTQVMLVFLYRVIRDEAHKHIFIDDPTGERLVEEDMNRAWWLYKFKDYMDNKKRDTDRVENWISKQCTITEFFNDDCEGTSRASVTQVTEAPIADLDVRA